MKTQPHRVYRNRLCRLAWPAEVLGCYGFGFMAVAIVLFSGTVCRIQADSSRMLPRPDFSASVDTFDDTILHIRSREMALEARIERLAIDVATTEKKWRDARVTTTESRLGDDTAALSTQRSTVLWERLSALRIELENAGQLLDWRGHHRRIRTTLLKARSAPETRTSLWTLLADSLDLFLKEITEECQWRMERMRQNRFEYNAVDNMANEEDPDISLRQRRSTTQKMTHIRSRIVSDSLTSLEGRELQSLVKTYRGEVEQELQTVTLGQRVRAVGEKIAALWSFELWIVDGKSITVGKIIIALLAIIFGLKVAEFASTLITRTVEKRLHVDKGIAEAGRKLFFYGFAVLFSLYALYTVQVPLTIFTVAGGALALGIGFGSQNILNNFISGIILLMERPIKTGDFVEVDNAVGTVDTIGLRSTKIRTPGNVHIVLPNSSFLEKNFINWTLADRVMRIELRVGVVYGSPPEEVHRLLHKAAEENSSIRKEPLPLVLFSDFGDNALIFDMLLWVRITSIIDRQTILSDLRFRINELFNEAGIVIAFPQRDVHLDMEKPLRVTMEEK